jgi:hypothetical protein
MSRPIAAMCCVLAALLATACGGDTIGRAAAPVTRDSAGIRIVESSAPKASGLADSALLRVDREPVLTIGVESGDEPYQLNRVSDALRFPDGRIAISNSGTGEIRLFDAAGRYLRSVGRRGAGPGEFSEYSSVAMYPVGDSVLALDNGLFRLHLFGPDMQYVETRPFALTTGGGHPMMRGVFADESWLTMAYENGEAMGGSPGTVLRMRYALLHYDAKGQVMNDIVKLDSHLRFVHQFGQGIHFPAIPLSADPLDAVSGNDRYVLRGPKAEIEVYDRSGRLIRLVRWARPPTRTSDVWPQVKERDLASRSGQDRAAYADYYARDLPIPEFAPMYESMRIDATQRIWLQRYDVGSGATPLTWDVLARDGAWLGLVQTPRGFAPYRIGADYLLGRQIDSLGVERVQMLRTHAP